MSASVEISGTIRRRRDFSKNLSFLTLEIGRIQPNSPPDDLPVNNCIQFVCDGWEVPRGFVAGVAVLGKGNYEHSPKGELRFLVHRNDLHLQSSDEPVLSGWKQASSHAAWRARSATEICTCKDPLCVKWHDDPTRWAERKKRRHDSDKDVDHKPACCSNCKDEHPSEAPASKAKHNFVFASWVMETFSDSMLQRGVVDFAGGRGLISMKLALEHQLRVVLVEPKELKINTTYRRRIRKHWRKKHGATLADEEKDISGIDSKVDAKITVASDACDIKSSRDHVGDELVTENGGELQLPLLHLREEFYGLSGASMELKEALDQCELFLAMHPDSATGAVVETAIALRKPFAVVPCCVFSYMFPDRKTPDGNTVATYEELVDYLESLGNGVIKRATLPFEGRNTVLYCFDYDPV